MRSTRAFFGSTVVLGLIWLMADSPTTQLRHWTLESPAAAAQPIPADSVHLPLVLRAAQLPAGPPPATSRPPTPTPTQVTRTAPPPTTAPTLTSTTPTQPSTTPGAPASPTPTSGALTTSSPTAETDPSPTPTSGPTAPAADCGAIEGFDAGRLPILELFVAPGGSDQNGDGSPARPFATLGRAARGVRPGTAIRLKTGTYAGGSFLEDLRGTADAPIWLGGLPGAPSEARPVLVGSGEGLHLVRPAFLVIHDLEVRSASANGINADDGGAYADPAAAHHLVFRNLDIHDVGGTGNQDCLKLSGVTDVLVASSRFRTCGGAGAGSGIDMVGGHRVRVARNRFEDMSGNAVQAKGGSVDVEVWANVMQNAGERAVNMGGSTGFEYFRPPLAAGAPNAEARDIRVLANLIVGSQAPVAYVGCVGCLVANNTLVDPGRWVMRILQETTSQGGFAFEPARDGRFVNNLVYFERARLSTFANVGANTAPETFAFAHNLWYAHDAPARSQPSLPVPEVGGVLGRDPRLGADFRPGPDSPTRGAGIPVAGLRGDADGRCYGAVPSIGAYEVP